MVEARSVLGVGDRVGGRYLLERRLGQGGMGAVFVAQDERLGRRVALKTLLAAASDHGAQRLEAEARAVASLDHPGIVTLFDVVAHGDDLVLVMELVDGESLRDVLERGPMEVAEVGRVISATADALAAAHARGLVHRDVKPDNLMVRVDGRVALLDFGIAKPIAPALASPLASSLTGAGTILGTPAYLAPEQAEGGAVTPATDQFALAVVAFELLTGAVPWRTSNLATLLADILSKTAPNASATRSELDPRVDAVLARGLEKSPEARFPDVRRFADALSEALDLAPIEAPRTKRAQRRVDPFSSTQDEAGLVRGVTARPIAPAEGSPRRTRRLVGFAGVGIGVLAAGALALHFALPSTPTTSSASATASVANGAPPPLLLEELAPSHTDGATAAASYRAAVHALSVGDPRKARTLLDDAIAEDRRFASALLQRAFLSLVARDALDAPGRAAFRAALDERGSLSERDAALLDALAPSFVDPPDWAATAKRLEAFLASRPGDEQAWLARMAVHMKLADSTAALADAESALALDPKAGLALVFRAQLAFLGGDAASAQKQLATCIQLLPENVNCRIIQGSLAAAIGACDDAERAGRGLTSLAPDNPYGYELRAAASSRLGAAEVAIADLLSKRTASMPEATRRPEEAFDAYRLAVRRGDFDGALAELDVRDNLLREDDAEARGADAVERAKVLCEMGEAARCAVAATSWLERAASRPVPERIVRDPTATLLAYAHAAGALDDATFHARRDAWAGGWRARLGEGWREEGNAAWLMAYIAVGDPTSRAAEGEAKEALEARARFEALTLPSLSALGSSTFGMNYETSLGAILLASGKLDEARSHLESATRACTVVPDVRAHYLLGLVHDRQGDAAAACSEFAVVERYWGHAKPDSTTAKAARTRAKSCAAR